jgi:predicted nucleic acid-binding protein
MDKPQKPKKKIVIHGSTKYEFNFVSNKVSLIVFLDWLKTAIPKGASDVTLELAESKYEEDGDASWIEIAWAKEIKNKDYDKEMKKYKKQLAKWKKSNEKENK